MKLSEAILLGSTLSEQCFGKLEINGRRCAIGAALAAVGDPNRREGHVEDAIGTLWPHVRKGFKVYGLSGLCPVLGCLDTSISLADVIVHLNDQHRWTRERIAEWVAQFDPAPVQVQDIQDEHTAGGPGPGIALLEVPAL